MGKKRRRLETRSRSTSRPGILFYALVTLVPLAFCPQMAAPTSAKIPIIMAIAGFALLATLNTVAGRRIIPRVPLLYPLLAVLAWKTISTAYGGHFYASAFPLLQAFVYCAIFIGVIGSVATKEQVRRILFAASCGAIPVCLIGIAERFGLRLPGFSGIFDGRIFSTMGNPTFLAAYLGMLLPVQLSLLFTEPLGWRRWLLGASASLGYVCIIWTATRGTWIGLALAIPALLWMIVCGSGGQILRQRARAISLAAVAMLIVTILAGVMLPSEDSREDGLDSTRIGVRSSDTLRASLMKAGLRMFRDYPVVGVGLGGYQVHYLDYIKQKPIPGSYYLSHDYAHNDIIHTAAEEGIPGLVIYAWALLALSVTIVTGLKRARAGQDAESAVLIAGMAAGLIAFSGDVMTNVAIRQTHVGVFCWMMLGLLSVMWRVGEPEVQPERVARRSSLVRMLLLGTGVMVTLALLMVGIRSASSDVHTYKAALAASNINWNEALVQNQKALELNPYSPLSLYWLGIAHREAGGTKESLQALDDFQEKYPHSNRIDFEMGNTHLALGNVDEAAQSYQEAVSRDPADFPAWQGLAMSNYLLGRKEEAYRAASEAVRQGRNQTASSSYGASPVAPSPGAHHYVIGSALARTRKYEQAAHELKLAVERSPDNAEYLTALGAVQLPLGALADAEESLLTAISADSRAVDARAYLANVYIQTGRIEAARHELEKALELTADPQRQKTFETMLRKLR